MKFLETLILAIENANPAAKAVGVVAASVAVEPVVGPQAVPFFGVSLTTLGMAAAGSMIAFAYGTPVTSRGKLYGYAIGGIFMGVWSVQILPDWLAWQWYDKAAMEPPVAGVAAFVSRWVAPLVVEHLPMLWRRLTNNPAPPGDKP